MSAPALETDEGDSFTPVVSETLPSVSLEHAASNNAGATVPTIDDFERRSNAEFCNPLVGYAPAQLTFCRPESGPVRSEGDKNSTVTVQLLT